MDFCSWAGLPPVMTLRVALPSRRPDFDFDIAVSFSDVRLSMKFDSLSSDPAAAQARSTSRCVVHNRSKCIRLAARERSIALAISTRATIGLGNSVEFELIEHRSQPASAERRRLHLKQSIEVIHLARSRIPTMQEKDFLR